VRRIRRLGFDYVELCIDPPKALPGTLRDLKRDLRRALADFPTLSIGHSMWYIDVSTPYFPSVRECWKRIAKEVIEVCAMLELRAVVFHAYGVGLHLLDHRAWKKAADVLVESLEELMKFGRERGVEVWLENMPIDNALGRFEGFSYVVSRVRELGVVFDIGHAYVVEKRKGLLRMIKALAPRIRHVHVSDNHGSVDDHLPLGKGRVPLRRALAELRAVGYDGTFTLEVFKGGVKGLRRSKDVLKRIWRSLEKRPY